MLVYIIDAAPSLATLYASPILDVLDAQLKTAEEEGLILVAFDLTRRLARHAGQILKDKAMTFARYTLDALRDQASIVKRRAAVVTLTDVVAYTACMSEVAALREDFIDLLVAHLATETGVAEKRDTVKALGMLGATRPSVRPEDVTERLVKTWALDAEAASSASSLESGLISTEPEVMRIRMPLYIADWVMGQLIAIWREPTLRIHHLAVGSGIYCCFRYPLNRDSPQVADAVVRIFRHERSRARSWHFLETLIPRFYDAITDRTLDSTSTCFYISALGKVAKVAESRIEDHVEPILSALVRRWDEGLEPSNCIVDTISDLSTALRGGFQRYLPLVIPKLCSALLAPACSEATVAGSLRFLQESAGLLRDWTHAIIPALLSIVEKVLPASQNAIMDTLLALACFSHTTPHLSRIMPVLSRLHNNPRLSEKAHRTMCGIAKECGKEANSFIQGLESHTGVVILGHPFYAAYAEGTGGEFEPV